MTDFVDRKSLIMDILCAGKIGKLTCIDIIKRAREVDVQPVVHGKWVKNGWSIRCSKCGYDMPYTIRNFCPNCGAKMDMEDNK